MVSGFTCRHVIAESVEVYSALPENLIIPFFLMEDYSFFLEEAFRVRRVIAPRINVRAKLVSDSHFAWHFKTSAGLHMYGYFVAKRFMLPIIKDGYFREQVLRPLRLLRAGDEEPRNEPAAHQKLS